MFLYSGAQARRGRGNAPPAEHGLWPEIHGRVGCASTYEDQEGQGNAPRRQARPLARDSKDVLAVLLLRERMGDEVEAGLAGEGVGTDKIIDPQTQPLLGNAVPHPAGQSSHVGSRIGSKGTLVQPSIA